MLQTLLTSCPLIVNLIIEHCIGLKNIKLQTLSTIISLTINTHLPVKIYAPTLEQLAYSSYWLEQLNIVDYEINLKSLEISCTDISDGFLNHLISIPYCFESLILANFAFGSFDICRSPSLRVLKIKNCKTTGEIDAPNLLLFEYKGRVIPPLKFAKESRQLKHSKIILDSLYNLDAAWFCKLRKFLSDSISWSQVSLYFLKCNEINMKDLQLHQRVAIPKVDVLDVKIFTPIEECPTFVDALLWSCHPRKLNLQSTSEMFTCFAYHLMYMKDLSRVLSHERHNQLKEVKVYKFGQKSQSWHHVKYKRGELSIMTVSKSEKYFFLLDW